MNKTIFIALFLSISLGLVLSFKSQIKTANQKVDRVIGAFQPVADYKSPKSPCDDSLWKHVYTGDPRKFKKPQDRLKVIEPCGTAIGKIINAKAEADGDWHIRLDVDNKSLLNAKNISSQSGYLVLEPVCEGSIKQKDVLLEGVCDNFKQSVFDKSMIGKRVKVTGAFVTDEEHGWNEIHPVTKIEVTP